METTDDVKHKYQSLDWDVPIDDESAISPQYLLAFPYEYPGSEIEIVIDTDEFTAVCPWTGLPDLGTLLIKYVPNELCVELKSLKYYLLSYRNVGIMQEHAANRILKDLSQVCSPKTMTLNLDYKPRGGIHTSVSVVFGRSKTLDNE